MIERTGRIIAIHSYSMEVEIATPSACSQCGSAKSCHGPQEQRIELPLSPGFAKGDSVTLGIEDRQLHGSALIAYLMPTLALMLGAGLGDALSGSNTATFIGAGVGLAAGLLAIRPLSRGLGLGGLTPSVSPCNGNGISTHQESSQP